jgi:prepilin-type N-terminal cleavage/methylation domain-containing protein
MKARDRRAFTFIEMLAVLAIIALMAGLSVVGLSRKTAKTIDDVAAELCDYDQGARLSTQRFGTTMELRIDPQQVQLTAVGRTGQALRPALVLPSGFAIRQCTLGGHPANVPGATLQIGPQGRSQTYGMKLTGPDGKSRWIVTIGPTGQQRVSENDAESSAIFSMLSQKRLLAP